MAEVRLADVYNPLVFDPAVQEKAIELNAFAASGVLQSHPDIDAMASGPGNVGELPFYLGLDNPQADGTNEPYYSNDVTADLMIPANVTKGKMIYRSAHLAKSWSTMDLSRELALQDPLEAIVNRVSHYWAVNSQLRVIQSSLGVLADNVATNGGDMLYTIATDDVLPILAAEKISPTAVLMAKATMGDHAEMLTAIAMHSVVYTELQDQNVIIYETSADATIRFPTYLGYRVVVDDSMPAVTGVNRTTYTSVLFSAGAMAHGNGAATVPSETQRDPDKGNGGGQETLYSRGTEIIHPMGFAFNSASVAGQSADFSELADAANWDRVYAERKNIGMAFLQTNG